MKIYFKILMVISLTAIIFAQSGIAQLSEGFESGNFNGLSWTFGGNANWTVASDQKYAGTYSAKSGVISHSQTTYMQVVLNTYTGNITFYRKVSSESGFDYLKFYIDGILQSSSWSGEVVWGQVSYAVTAGTRTFKWEYSKDGSVSSGSDCAWVDDIVFPVNMTPPTTQAINIVFSSVTSSSSNVGWTNGDGGKRAVFVKQANTGTASPIDNTTYTASTTFGSGTQIGSSGWYCVYNGTGTSVSICGLNESTEYIAHVCEYNNSAGSEKYLTTSSTDNPKSQSTIALVTPSIQASNITFPSVSSSGMSINWTCGNGTNRIVFMKQANSGTASPSDNTTYTASSTFGNGAQIGSTGWYCVYNGSGTSVSISGLNRSSEYIVQVLEYNGNSGSEKYLTSTSTNNPNTQTTTAGIFVGSGQTYTTLKSAFDAINAGTLTGGIYLCITSDLTETVSATLNASGSGSANYSSVNIIPVGSVKIYGSINGSLINLNGADNVTINGLNTGGNSLTIENSSTSTTASSILFTNTATYNVVTNCTVLGSPAYSSDAYSKRGVISFTGSGNSYTQITFCNIGPSGANKPSSCINSTYHTGSTSNITVSNCNIYDFYAGGQNGNIGAGLHVGYVYNEISNDNWTITNNSFYQTNELTANLGKIICIYIHKGNNYSITNNYFGGRQANCGGSPMTINGTPYSVGFLFVDGHTSYSGIPNATGANVLSGNTISNINIYSSNTTNTTDYSDGGRFFGCSIRTGNWTVTNNNFGSMSENGKIVLEDANQSVYSFMHFFGNVSSTMGPVVSSISGNNIGGITINSTNADLYLLYIWYSNTGYKCQVDLISNNTFGSSSTNSIYAPNANNSSRCLTGIYPNVSNTATLVNITQNTIQNISLNNGNIYCISTSKDINCTQNTFKNISTVNGSNFSGISMSSNDNYASSTISRNLIMDCKAATTIKGISATSYYRTVNTNNNIIILGRDISTNAVIMGIYQYYVSNIYFNTVFIGGTGTSGTSNSYAYYRDANWYGTTSVRNNVFFNSRSNNGGTGSHYSAYFGRTDFLTVNNNDYFVNGTGGVIGYYNSSNITSWPNANLGANSLNTNPNFSNASGTSAENFMSAATLVGATGLGITSDYLGSTRASVPNMGAFEGSYYVWTGETNSDWNTATNWSTNSIPTSGQNIIIKSGASNMPITSEILNVGTIELQSGTSVNLGADMQINGTLILSTGLINLGNNNLTLGASSTISGTPSATNMIVATGTGELRKTFSGTGSFTFPVGDNSGTAEYSPITLNFTSGTFSSAYVGINLSNTKYSNNSSSSHYLNRYWTVTQSGISDFSCNVTAQYLPADVVGTESNIWGAKYSGGVWTLLSQSDAVNHRLTGTVTGFSTFTGGEEGTLPVTLLSFTSNINGRNVILKWTTASETNNAGFNVERKSGNENWVSTGFVTGKGNTNLPTNYMFEDKKLNSGKYQYRLKQADINGNFEYHNLSGLVEVGLPSNFELGQNYPNPFNPTTKIDFSIPLESKVNIVLYDLTGREVRTIVNEEMNAGYYTKEINGNSLASGIYFYRIIAKSGTKNYTNTKKMMLIK